ncbi:MAG: ComEC/Rec2 family competence protein [Ginsengibacter sp.]
MAKVYKIFIWKKAPFLRLLLPVIAGIIVEFYVKFKISSIIIAGATTASAYVIFRFLPFAYRFIARAVNGIIITIFMIIAGLFLTWNKDIRNHYDWYGNRYDTSSYILATVLEPPVEKNKSYKALVKVEAIIKKDSAYSATGNLLVYFARDSAMNTIQYGTRIIIKKDLQEIKNSGNPAGFDYVRYCSFQQIFHQCYLKQNEWALLQGPRTNFYKRSIFKTRQFVINVLNQYIEGNDESALAKALLIGYKIDLDKDLVQAYSNAGVVHLIAISGLHLALIYAILLWITGKIPFLKRSKLLRLVVILFCLWFFALLTGASASVLRSAVMFSFIATGLTFKKNSSIYNSLAMSAFILLCYDPFMLWDVGFQLSYLAVLGIVISQRYIYNWFYFSNKLLDKTWKLASVSLAAQVFTLPICLYYFHQFPLLFLLSNMIAIPLSTIVLWGCLLLVLISPLRFVAIYLGKIISVSIWLLNHTVLMINKLPFSVWDGISLSVTGTILLYAVFTGILYWLIKKNITAFKFGICAMFIFIGLTAFKKWGFSQQKKIIVYNIPAHKAIDFASGHEYHFIGDSDLAAEGLLQNFHLKPGRISLMLRPARLIGRQLYQHNNFYQFYGKRILLIDSAITYEQPASKVDVDYILVSKNPKLFIPNLAKVFNCSLYIFDASNPMWKIDKWKKDCEELHLRFHSVPEQGAFVTDL